MPKKIKAAAAAGYKAREIACSRGMPPVIDDLIALMQKFIPQEDLEKSVINYPDPEIGRWLREKLKSFSPAFFAGGVEKSEEFCAKTGESSALVAAQ